MSEKQFVIEELEIFDEENDWKGESWWAVINTQRIEDCFPCQNKEVALRLCDFLNKATDDFKWQIRRCEKWSAILRELKENDFKEDTNMIDKRFECVFIEDDDFGLISEKIEDNETNITYHICDVADLLNFQNTQIRLLKEENNYLQKRVEAILEELYCKDRKLEELGVPLECCDTI